MSVTDPPLFTPRRVPKREYRLFLLGHNDRITGSRDLEASTDEEAIAAARAEAAVQMRGLGTRPAAGGASGVSPVLAQFQLSLRRTNPIAPLGSWPP